MAETEDIRNRLNSLITRSSVGLPFKRRVRMSVLSHISNTTGLLSSSNDLSIQEISNLLDAYFENWRLFEAMPTEDESQHMRTLCEKFSRQWVAILGEPDSRISYPPVGKGNPRTKRRNAAKKAKRLAEKRMQE